MNYAFFSLLSSDDYSPGIIGLNNSIKANSTYSLHCLVTKDVSVTVVNSLRSKDITVHTIEDIDVNWTMPYQYLKERRSRLKGVISKVYLWSMVDFKKILFIDADAFVLQNVDTLFDLPVEFAASRDWASETFNSGVMLLSPSYTTFNELLKYTKQTQSYCTGGDQGLFNNFFGELWLKTPLAILPQGYNFPSVLLYEDSYVSYLRKNNQLHIVHYMHSKKPWNIDDIGEGVNERDIFSLYKKFLKQ